MDADRERLPPGPGPGRARRRHPAVGGRRRQQGFPRPFHPGPNASCGRASRHRALRPLRARDHRPRRHAASRSRGGFERARADARIRAAAIRGHGHPRRDGGGRPVRPAAPLLGCGPGLRAGHKAPRREGRDPLLRRTGDEERRGLRPVAPDGRGDGNPGCAPGDIPQGAAARGVRNDAGLRSRRRRGDLEDERVGPAPASPVRGLPRGGWPAGALVGQRARGGLGRRAPGRRAERGS